MGHTVDHMDDFVVDMVLEVDSRGIGVGDLARRICLPGMEILRTSARGTIWLTAVVFDEGESAAIRAVRDSVLAQLPDRPRANVTSVVNSAPLGDLYARLAEGLEMRSSTPSTCATSSSRPCGTTHESTSVRSTCARCG